MVSLLVWQETTLILSTYRDRNFVGYQEEKEIQNWNQLPK